MFTWTLFTRGFSLHWAALGYIHVPFPPDASQTALVKAFLFLHDWGQQRLVSLAQPSQCFDSVKWWQFQELPQSYTSCRHLSLSFGMHTGLSTKLNDSIAYLKISYQILTRTKIIENLINGSDVPVTTTSIWAFNDWTWVYLSTTDIWHIHVPLSVCNPPLIEIAQENCAFPVCEIRPSSYLIKWIR